MTHAYAHGDSLRVWPHVCVHQYLMSYVTHSVLQGCTQVSWLVKWQVNWLVCSLLLTCHLTCQLTCVQTCQLTSQLTCHKCAALTCVQTGSTCCYDWQSTRVRSTWDRLIGLHIGLFCRISSLLYGSFAKETYNFKYDRHVTDLLACMI